MDKKELIELYKITLERLYHHDTILTQAYIGLAIMVPIFLAATAFLFGKSSPVDPFYTDHVKWSILILALLLSLFYWRNSYRINKVFAACNKVIGNLETKLLETQAGSALDGSLLVGKEINKIKAQEILLRNFFWLYPLLNILILIVFGLFLFVCIDKLPR